MASQPPKDQNSKETAQSSDTNSNQTSPPLPATSTGDRRPPTNNYPHAMGYPPAMGYPYPHGQQGYPYAYTDQQPPASDYNDQSYHQTRSEAVVRAFCMACLVTITLSCLLSIVIWFFLRPEYPIFKVQTFSVSNFKPISGSELTGNWDANVSVENPNPKLRLYFNNFRSFIYYKEAYLSSSFVEPLVLAARENDVMHVKVSMNNTDQNVMEKPDLDEIGQERKGGSVTFNLRMLVSVTFRSDSWLPRQVTMRVFCDRMKVEFVRNSGNGTFVPDNSRICAVYA